MLNPWLSLTRLDSGRAPEALDRKLFLRTCGRQIANAYLNLL